MFWEHSPDLTIIASDWLRAELSCGWRKKEKRMTVSLGSSLASEGICLFVDLWEVQAWITLCGMIKVYWLDLTWLQPTFLIMMSAVRLPQVRAEACISLQASWEQSKVWTVQTMFSELKVQLRNESLFVEVSKVCPANKHSPSEERALLRGKKRRKKKI